MCRCLLPIGLDIETIMYKNITFISWDFSGDHQSVSPYFKKDLSVE